MLLIILLVLMLVLLLLLLLSTGYFLLLLLALLLLLVVEILLWYYLIVSFWRYLYYCYHYIERWYYSFCNLFFIVCIITSININITTCTNIIIIAVTFSYVIFHGRIHLCCSGWFRWSFRLSYSKTMDFVWDHKLGIRMRPTKATRGIHPGLYVH